MFPSKEGWGVGIDWEFMTDTYKLLYLKQITNKDLLLLLLSRFSRVRLLATP